MAMTALASNHLENIILNTLRGTSAVGFDNLYLELFLTAPTKASPGTPVSYPEYQRQQIQWTAPAPEGIGLGIHNATDILFSAPSTNVGEVRYVGIFDAQTGGNMILFGAIAIPLNLIASVEPSLRAGYIMYYLTGDSTVWWKTQCLNLLRGTTIQGFTPHLALFSGDPEGSGVELQGTTYAREPLNFSTPTIDIPNLHFTISNLDFVQFNDPTAPGWGNWQWNAIMTAATGGNPVFKAPTPLPGTIHAAYTPTVREGRIRLGVR